MINMPIKNCNGVIVKIDEKTGKEEVIARTNDKELAKQATKNLNIAERMKGKKREQPKELEGTGTFFMDKYHNKYKQQHI